MLNVLIEAIEELKAAAYSLKTENSQLKLDLKQERDSNYRMYNLYRRWYKKYTELEAQVSNDKRKRQLQEERQKWEKRKRELKRQHKQDASVGNWSNSLNTVHTYLMWKHYDENPNSPTSRAFAKEYRDFLDEWKEAHRVKTTTDRS